jgi:hypothetical protein
MANTPDKPQMSDDERADLMAMIAAGRELSPEMDTSLIDSYAERRAAEKQARDKVQGNAVVAQQPSPVVASNGQHPAVAITGIVATVAIFIAIMVFTQGHGWWLLFPLFGIFGGWWGRNDRYRVRDARRAERYQMRADYYRARMGYPRDEEAQRLPESAGSDSGPLPPPIGVPAQTPPSPRTSTPASSTPADQPPINPAG